MEGARKRRRREEDNSVSSADFRSVFRLPRSLSPTAFPPPKPPLLSSAIYRSGTVSSHAPRPFLPPRFIRSSDSALIPAPSFILRKHFRASSAGVIGQKENISGDGRVKNRNLNTKGGKGGRIIEMLESFSWK